MDRIQLIAIAGSISFLGYIGWLITKGKLREEYAIVWIVLSGVLILFSFWRSGLDVLAHSMGVYSPPNTVFILSIIAILIYLLHISIVVSKLQEQNKTLAQELAILKNKSEKEK